VFSRRIVGWRTASSMTTNLVMDALNMAIHSRRLQLINNVIVHSDAGSQHVAASYGDVSPRSAHDHQSDRSGSASIMRSPNR